jgi:hypothetical protein
LVVGGWEINQRGKHAGHGGNDRHRGSGTHGHFANCSFEMVLGFISIFTAAPKASLVASVWINHPLIASTGDRQEQGFRR